MITTLTVLGFEVIKYAMQSIRYVGNQVGQAMRFWVGVLQIVACWVERSGWLALVMFLLGFRLGKSEIRCET